MDTGVVFISPVFNEYHLLSEWVSLSHNYAVQNYDILLKNFKSDKTEYQV